MSKAFNVNSALCPLCSSLTNFYRLGAIWKGLRQICPTCHLNRKVTKRGVQSLSARGLINVLTREDYRQYNILHIIPNLPKPKLTAKDYPDYIISDRWRSKRKFILTLKGEKCSLCGSRQQLRVHHLNYKRLGKEKPKDLVVVCESCHRQCHWDKDRKISLSYQSLGARYRKLKKQKL